MPEVSCKAVAVQNSSEWPCFVCTIPQLWLVGVSEDILHIYFFLIFPGHPELWTSLQIPTLGHPLAVPCYTSDKNKTSRYRNCCGLLEEKTFHWFLGKGYVQFPIFTREQGVCLSKKQVQGGYNHEHMSYNNSLYQRKIRSVTY